MSYYTMSNKELSQLIRKTLKENGYTSKDVSVRVRAALYDTSVNITVKNPLVRLSEVEKGKSDKYTYKPTYWISSAQDLAVAMWRFKNTGTIYA